MVDINGKGEVVHEAVAAGKIYLPRPATLTAIREETVVKGNVLATARVAATLSVKNTPTLIPMCHSIAINAIAVDFSEGEDFIESRVRVKSTGKTRGEREAPTGVSVALLTICPTGVSVALLTIWDMVKSAEKDEHGQYPVTRIEDIHVIEKRKG